MPKITKKWEVRYFVTAVASVPLYKSYGKTEAYKQAAKDGWGTVYRDENNVLVCDEDCSASLYTKDGGYFGIFPYEEIDTTPHQSFGKVRFLFQYYRALTQKRT